MNRARRRVESREFDAQSRDAAARRRRHQVRALHVAAVRAPQRLACALSLFAARRRSPPLVVVSSGRPNARKRRSTVTTAAAATRRCVQTNAMHDEAADETCENAAPPIVA